MPKLERIKQEIFANSAGSREVTTFGTAKNETPTYSKDAGTIQNDNFLQGWNSAVLADKAPYMEDSNALYYVVTRQLAYLFQSGIPEWDENTTYYAYISYCQVNGTIYQSLTNNNIGNDPTTDTTNWQDFWGTVKSDIQSLNSAVTALNASITELNNSKANISLSNANTAGYTEIMRAVMPNWSKAVTKSSGTTYTATQYGWIQAQGSTAQGGIGIRINGIWVAYTEAEGRQDTSGFGCLVPVNKGDTYWGSRSMRFIPCVGEG